MSYTRQQLDDLVKAQMDASGSYRFESTLLRATMDVVFTRGWHKILSANRYVRMAKRTVTTDAAGQITIQALDGGTGDTAERFYRVLAAAQGTILYAPAEFMENPLGTTLSTPSYTFERQGDVIQFLPVQEGTAMSVWVNHIPQKPSALSASTATVTWPTDYELIVVYETAARLMAKGAAEIDGTSMFQQLADDLWRDCLTDLARFTTDPITMGAADTAADWGA